MGGRGEAVGSPGVTVPGLREDRERFREPPALGCRGREKRDVSAHEPKVRLGPRESALFPNPVAGASARPAPGPPGRVWCVWGPGPRPLPARGAVLGRVGIFPGRAVALTPGRQPEPGARAWTPRGTLRAAAPSQSAAGVWGRGPWQTEPESRGVWGRGQKRGLLTGTPGAWCSPRGEHSSHPVDGCADSNTIAVNCERRRRAGAEYNRGRCLLGSLGWCHILSDGYYYYSLPVGNVTGTRTN